MEIKLYHNITCDEFFEINESVWPKTYSKRQVEIALENTMYIVKAEVDGKLAGMGRIVGDKSISCLLTNVTIKPEYQKMGIGTMIVKELKNMVEKSVKNGEKMQIELCPTAGNESFYQKCGFKYKPDKITGMYLWIEK